MENKELEKNIDRIGQYDKELANKILMTNTEKSNIKVVQNENGDYNLVYNNYFLHSNTDISKEVEEIVNTIGHKDNANVIRVVYGLGLGYLADKISELSGTTIIYEPNLDILKFVFSIATIDAIFKDNVYVCSDKQTLSELVLNHSNSETKMTMNFLPSYLAMYSNDIEDTIKTMQVAKGGHNATKNTLLKLSPRAIQNTFKSLKKIISCPDITQLKDVYKGKTAILLSAGPSLKDNIEIIKNNQDKFVIFAVNPTIKLLQASGIKPDFISVIETADTTMQLSTIDTKDYYFIMEAFTNEITRSIETRKVFNYISTMNFVNPWLRSCMKLTGELETMGTVSYTTLMSAYLMGFKKIILCGQDLAYKDGRCYAKGSQFEELECVFDEAQNKYVIKAKDFEKYAQSFKSNTNDMNFCRNAAKRHINFLNGNIYTATAQDGGKIPTQTGYALFIEWFERAAQRMKKENPDIELINSSIGGALIRGFDTIPLSEVVEKLEPVEKLNLDNYEGNYDINYIKLKFKLLYEKLSVYVGFLHELLEVSQKLLKEINIKRTFTNNILKLIKKQDDLLMALINSKKDSDLKHIIFYSLCKYADIMSNPDSFKDVQTAKKSVEAIIQISKEADLVFGICLKSLADY